MQTRPAYHYPNAGAKYRLFNLHPDTLVGEIAALLSNPTGPRIIELAATDARTRLERALAIRVEVLGPNHPNTQTVRAALDSLIKSLAPAAGGESDSREVPPPSLDACADFGSSVESSIRLAGRGEPFAFFAP